MTALLLALLNLSFIGTLPRVFFRRGRLHLRWWLTAMPFFLAAAALIAGSFGWIDPAVPSASTVGIVGRLLALPLATGSIALIGYTLGTHREPVSLWHQDDDSPDRLVTWGAYSRVRHPFYAAFLLALLGSAAAFPHGATFAAVGAACVGLARTAAREERRLLASFHGSRYRAYMARTGRFVPRRRPGPLLGR